MTEGSARTDRGKTKKEGVRRLRPPRVSEDTGLLAQMIIRLVPETRMILSKPSFHEQRAASLSRLVLASVLA